jgi:hypothetical protein
VDADKKLHKGYEFEEHPGVCAAMEAAARHLLFQSEAEAEAAETAGAEAAARGGPATVITEEA